MSVRRRQPDCALAVVRPDRRCPAAPAGSTQCGLAPESSWPGSPMTQRHTPAWGRPRSDRARVRPWEMRPASRALRWAPWPILAAWQRALTPPTKDSDRSGPWSCRRPRPARSASCRPPADRYRQHCRAGHPAGAGRSRGRARCRAVSVLSCRRAPEAGRLSPRPAHREGCWPGCRYRDAYRLAVQRIAAVAARN
ncbi:Uncharacterised protein [Mycobacteroides abscessus subsp. massiliense]|nr:Uncharacterised protein [Mycobacteroides abscessus subsp. massiliense]SKW12429.1 Uncharacterised protein [Mycobacteroides abscessus subsp. massiliense]